MLILLRSLRDIEKAANAPMMGTGPGAGALTVKLLMRKLPVSPSTNWVPEVSTKIGVFAATKKGLEKFKVVKGKPEANSAPPGLLNVKVSVDDPEVNLSDPKVTPPGLKI